MGMFDSFRIRAFESNIEVQTKDFENTLENYYFLSKVFDKKYQNNTTSTITTINSNNISFLQEYIIDEYGEDNEFLICFKNGIFVDFCFLGKNKNLSFKEIQKIKESLILIWSDNNFFSDLLMIKNDISDYNYNLTSHYLVKYKNLVNSANDYYETKKENNISNKNNKLNKAQKSLLNFFEEINNPLYDYITKKYKKLNVFLKEESQKINKKNYTKKDSLIPISIDKSLSDSLPEEESKIYDENLFNYEKNINDLFYKYYIDLKNNNKNNPNLSFNHSFTFMYYDILEKINNNNIKIEDINNFIMLGGNILDIINKYENSVSLDIINNTILNNLENILSYGDTNYINYLIENKSNINEIDIINSVNKVYQYVINYDDNAEYNKNFSNIKTSLFEMVNNLKQSNTYYIQNGNKNIFDIFLENEINYYKKQKDNNIVLLYLKFTNKLFEYLFVNDKLCYYQNFNNFQKLVEDVNFDNMEITSINTIEKLNHLKQKIEQNYLSNKLIKLSSKAVTKSKI